MKYHICFYRNELRPSAEIDHMFVQVNSLPLAVDVAMKHMYKRGHKLRIPDSGPDSQNRLLIEIKKGDIE